MVILKIGVWGYTGSEAIFAATLDGIMDVVSQTLNFASRKITPTEKYPMGKIYSFIVWQFVVFGKNSSRNS
jgi:divalent metal cation (Fe/Co/Zn/Cd) transporter